MTYYNATESKALDVVEFVIAGPKGKEITFRTPSNCEVIVTGTPRPMTWTVQNGIGLSGATRRYGGLGLAEGTITIKMVNDAQRAEFKAGMWRYFAPPVLGDNAKEYAVKHPLFAEYPTTPVLKVVCLDGPPGDWDRVAQMKVVVYKWGEARKALPTLSSTTTAGQTKDGSKAKTAAKAKVEAQIEAKTAENAALSATLAES